MRPLAPCLLAILLVAVSSACKSSKSSSSDVTGGPAGSAADRPTLKIAAASDLSLVFKDVGKEFEAKTGQKVSFSFGSSGLLAKQIAEGAPFDLFAAANVAFADDVIREGVCFADTKALYARGHIVLFTARGDAPRTLASLTDSQYVKVAIANPDHAPYGRAAKQALTKAGLWGALKSKIVYGENIQQTLTFAQSGNADIAIVALSLARNTPGSYAPIEDEDYDPIDQALVVCKGEARTAQGAPNAEETSAPRQFAEFVNSREGRAIMKRSGFLLPGETLAEKR